MHRGRKVTYTVREYYIRYHNFIIKKKKAKQTRTPRIVHGTIETYSENFTSQLYSKKVTNATEQNLQREFY